MFHPRYIYSYGTYTQNVNKINRVDDAIDLVQDMLISNEQIER